MKAEKRHEKCPVFGLKILCGNQEAHERGWRCKTRSATLKAKAKQ